MSNGLFGIGVPPAALLAAAAQQARDEGPGKKIARRLVPNGAIYTRGGVRYYAMGDTKTFLAVEAGSGTFVSHIDPEMLVEVVGSYTIDVVGGQWPRSKARRDVLMGEVFHTPNGSLYYANLGMMVDGRMAAINLENPTAQDFVVSRSLSKPVFVTGAYHFVEKLAAAA